VQAPSSAAVGPAPASPPRAAGGTASAAPVEPPNGFRFAVIGDFGFAGPAERRVAELVKAYRPAVV